MSYLYETFGEFKLPRTKSKSRLDDERLSSEFWQSLEARYPGLIHASGCYILAIRNSAGIRPWYVGKANGNKGFYQEALNHRNVRNINRQIDLQKSGTPIVFLIARMTPGGRFKNNRDERDLKWLERELIELALIANPDLMNKQATDFAQKVVLPGVINSPRKRYSESAKRLRRCLSLYSVTRTSTKADERAALNEVMIEIREQIDELESGVQDNEVGIAQSTGIENSDDFAPSAPENLSRANKRKKLFRIF
ncbi:MAG: hypothetical protein AAF197_13655 [Pseudomonadota bacterium]